MTLGAGFLRVLRFPLPIIIPSTAPHSSIIRGWYNRASSGRVTKLTQVTPTARIKKVKTTKNIFEIKSEGGSELRMPIGRWLEDEEMIFESQ
jgi:hypothetical protein